MAKKPKKLQEAEKKRYLEEYNPPKTQLKMYFPSVDEELIEEIYENVNRNFAEAQKLLEEMVRPPEVIIESNLLYQGSENSPIEDINSFDLYPECYEFKYYSDDESQTPDGNEKRNELDEFNLFEYIAVLHKIFPRLEQEVITNLLCDNDFDVEKTVEMLLDMAEKEEKKNMQESKSFFSAEVNSNVFGNLLDEEALIKQTELQLQIMKKAVKENIDDYFKPNYLRKEEYPALEGLESDSDEEPSFEEDYFTKPISHIRNKRTKADLLKLTRKFLAVDENEIKLYYYQFLNFNDTYNHIRKMHGQGVRDEKLKKPKPFANNQQNIEKLFKMGKISMEDYFNARKNLIYAAVEARRNGDSNESSRILEQARLFKTDVKNSIKGKNLEVFIKNNRNFSISYSGNKEMVIDLHGLSLNESLRLISCVISKCMKGKQIKLITGRGLHSKDGIAVLYPKVQDFLKSRNITYTAGLGFLDVRV